MRTQYSFNDDEFLNLSVMIDKFKDKLSVKTKFGFKYEPDYKLYMNLRLEVENFPLSIQIGVINGNKLRFAKSGITKSGNYYDSLRYNKEVKSDMTIGINDWPKIDTKFPSKSAVTRLGNFINEMIPWAMKDQEMMDRAQKQDDIKVGIIEQLKNEFKTELHANGDSFRIYNEKHHITGQFGGALHNPENSHFYKVEIGNVNIDQLLKINKVLKGEL